MELIIFLVFVYWLVYGGLFEDYDDTDEPEKKGMRRRTSDLIIKNDYGTGLQYLVAPFGGLTPRLDADGNHMRVPEEEMKRKPRHRYTTYIITAIMIAAVVYVGFVVI